MSDPSSPLRSSRQLDVEAAATGAVARQAAELWNATLIGAEPVWAVQNYVFAVERAGRPAILRLTHDSHRSVEEVEAELRWILDLKECGLPVAAPYRSRRDSRTETVPAAHGKFVSSCFEHLAGAEPDPNNPELWSDRMFEQLGALTARMHQAAYDAAWTPATLPRRTWRDESVAQNFHFYVPVGETAVHDAFDRVLAKLDALPRTRDAYGLIHADLNHGNFFLTPDGLSIFDFDDSCYCWFGYDLIVPIFHLPATTVAQTQQAFRLLLRGYESVRRFNPAWLKWLPLLLQWRDLLTYGFYYEQLEISALPENLRQKFLGMRARIESGRPIAEIGGAG